MSEQHAESRREFLKQAATVAWATPLVLTLAADPARAQAGSCAAPGIGCGAWDSDLELCLPLIPAVICCNDCEHPGGAETFCYCT